MDNRRLFATAAFEQWADRTDLIAPEAFLVDRFLDPRASVIEAGTGGGRILFELRKRGFTDLHGFDYVPRMIEAARRRDRANAIDFTVQDAVDLDHGDASFDQAIYLQQVMSFIEHQDGRDAALREARRILRPGGTALFSFLCFEARMRNPAYAVLARYLHITRRLRARSRSIQYQPWLRHGPRRNGGRSSTGRRTSTGTASPRRSTRCTARASGSGPPPGSPRPGGASSTTGRSGSRAATPTA